jgi:hypothetical protein
VAKERKPEREELRAVRARQRALGHELRRMYEGVVREPLPDEFLELLSRIDQSEAQKKKH